jgi:hypothetical protein
MAPRNSLQPQAAREFSRNTREIPGTAPAVAKTPQKTLSLSY